MSKAKKTSGASSAVASRPSGVVVRSTNIPPGRPYPEYARFLRRDFFYACAYCTMTEHEAESIRFTIDHYEPKSKRPDLENDYKNLMYACDPCNNRKGTICPTHQMRQEGKRFFRSDEDIRKEHFHLKKTDRGWEVEGTTNVGRFTVAAVDLNRPILRKIRAAREKLFAYDGYIGEGIEALTTYALDSLRPEMRQPALDYIHVALAVIEKAYDEFDDMLREFARSKVLGGDETAEEIEEDKERNRQRKAELHEMVGITPETWRGRKRRRSRH